MRVPKTVADAWEITRTEAQQIKTVEDMLPTILLVGNHNGYFSLNLDNMLPNEVLENMQLFRPAIQAILMGMQAHTYVIRQHMKGLPSININDSSLWEGDDIAEPTDGVLICWGELVTGRYNSWVATFNAYWWLGSWVEITHPVPRQYSYNFFISADTSKDWIRAE